MRSVLGWSLLWAAPRLKRLGRSLWNSWLAVLATACHSRKCVTGVFNFTERSGARVHWGDALLRNPPFCSAQAEGPVPVEAAHQAVQWARMSTQARMAAVTDALRPLRSEVLELRAIVNAYKDAEQRVRVRWGQGAAAPLSVHVFAAITNSGHWCDSMCARPALVMITARRGPSAARGGGAA